MPTAPPKSCSVPTCPSLVTADRPCPRHARPAFAGSPGRGGSTWAWRARRMFVLRERPDCAACAAEGLPPTRAVEVDHIRPVSMGGTDEDANLQPLCDPHHRRKSARDAAALRAYLKAGR